MRPSARFRRYLRFLTTGGGAALAVLILAALGPHARAGFISSFGDATNYALLFEGGGNGHTLQITNVTTNTAGTGSNAGNGQGGGIGNIGVGGTGNLSDNGPSAINGEIDFSAAKTGQFSNNNGSNTFINGSSTPTVNYSDVHVTNALNALNALNASLGLESGRSISIGTGGGQTLTINASSGILDANGNRVFTVSGFNTTNGDTLTINGDAAGDSVVLNFTSSANFNNQVALNGLTTDQVLYNFVGGSNLSGGPTLQINDNGNNHPTNVVQGDFLDPNGSISVVNANLLGRVFGGDSHDFQYVSGSNITASGVVIPAQGTVPAPPSVVLLGFGGLGLVVILLRSRRRLAPA